MRVPASVSVAVSALLLSGCVDLHAVRLHEVTATTSSPPTAASHRPSTAPTVALVRWRGPVEQLFVHPLVRQPHLAVAGDSLDRGFADSFVTVREFRAILGQLWRNGWTLVDPQRVAAGDVRVPRGRKPLVLQEDDVNYYAYFDGRGLASRLVLDGRGHVKAEYDELDGPVI